MASVTLFNAARMQAIEDGTVTSGLVDGQGHLILSHHDGTTVDAGKVTAANLADASDTVKGVVRLATDAETTAGTNDATAVTPQDLAAWATANRASAAETLAGVSATKLVTPLGLGSATTTYSGVVDPTWSGTGPTCPVILDTGQSDSGTKNVSYDPYDAKIQPGSVVVVSRTGGPTGRYFLSRAFPAYSIAPKQIPLQLQPTWGLWNDFNVDTTEAYGTPKYQQANLTGVDAGYIYASMSRYGIVRAEGLVQSTVATPAVGTVIATLPVGMRPTTEVICNCINGGGTAAVVVTPSGQIIYIGGTMSTYFSLSSIIFRAKSAVDLGLATFQPIASYLTGFAAYTGTYYTGGATLHTPGYTIDPDGVVIFEGAIVATTAYTMNTVVGTLTTLPFNYAQASHQPVVSPGATYMPFRYGTQTTTPLTGTNQFNFGSALSVGNYVPLNNVTLVDPNSTTAKLINANGGNGWIGYGSGWRSPSYAITPDGQVFPFGLWSAGTINANMMGFSTKIRPRYQLILLALSSSGPARCDARPQDGGIDPVTGSNAWFSLDGVSFARYMRQPAYPDSY